MRSIFIVVLAFSLLVAGCANPFRAKEAKFEIVATSEDFCGGFDMPCVAITIENVGDATGYDVSCRAYAKDSSEAVIDTGLAYFAEGGDIQPGEGAQDTAVFFHLFSWHKVGSVEYDLSWQTRK